MSDQQTNMICRKSIENLHISSVAWRGVVCCDVVWGNIRVTGGIL